MGPGRPINHPKRSTYVVTDKEREQLHCKTPDHTEIIAPIDDFMQCQFANRDPARARAPIPILQHRQQQAAHMRNALAQMVHEISRDFTMRDTNQIMDQLISRSHSNLEQYWLDSVQMQRLSPHGFYFTLTLAQPFLDRGSEYCACHRNRRWNRRWKVSMSMDV